MPENRKTNFIRQGTILAMASIIVRMIGIVYRIPVANIIGDEGNGIYGAAYEIYNLALILSSYSLPLAVSKLLSAQLANKNYRTGKKIFAASFIFSCISGGIMALLIFFGAGFIEKHFYSNFTGISIPLRVLAVTIFVVALLGTLRGFFQARKTMIPTAISQVLEQIVNAAGSIFFAWSFIRGHAESEVVAGWGAAGSTMGTLLGAATGLFFLVFIYIIYRPTVNSQLRRDKSVDDTTYFEIYKMLIATIIPVILGQTVYQLSGVIDSMMFSKLATGDSVSTLYGVYSTKYKLLVNVPIAIASAMASSLIPTLVAAFTKGDKHGMKKKIAVSIKVNMIIAFPCAFGLTALGSPIVRMLFPSSDYKLGGYLLAAGSVAVIFYALSTVTNAALQGINLMRKPVQHAAISLVIHVVLIFILLKFTKLGIYSLVIGNVTYPLVVCVLNAISVERHIHYHQEYRTTFIVPAIASAVMGACAYLIYRVGYATVHSNVIACLLSIVVAVVVYFVLILLLGGLTESDLPDFPMGMRIGRVAKKLHLM